MVQFTATIKKWGNSQGILIPRKKINDARLQTGQKVQVDLTPKSRVSGFGIAKGAKPFKREIDRKF